MKHHLLHLFSLALLAVIIDSCSKDMIKPAASSSPFSMGLYEYGADSGKRIFIPVTQVGTQSVDYFSVFDTGSSGMTIDAHGIIPSSMITSSGIQFSGDSVVVNGITIMAGQSSLSYGNQTGLTKEYGYLAYAPVTIGDANGKINAKRIPFFLYYKIVDGTGKIITANHSLDIFGVGPGTSYSNPLIVSPLTRFNTSASLINGFKLAVLPRNQFSSTGTFVSHLLTIGLTSDDVNSGGFIMHQLSNGGTGGYSPNIPATIIYGNNRVKSNVLFDTGTPLVSTIENALATNSIGQLPANTTVTITTDVGFTYTYTTMSTANLTQVQNPNETGDYRTIFGIDFFMDNEYLTNYANHQIGLKNN